MKIRLKTKEPLVNATYKISVHNKSQIDEIAAMEGLTQGDVARALIDYGIEAYHEGKVHRVWGETMMNYFRKQIQPGDKVVAGGLLGIVNGFENPFLKLEIAKGVEVKIIQDEITDILNPSKELLSNMARFQRKITQPEKSALKKTETISKPKQR